MAKRKNRSRRSMKLLVASLTGMTAPVHGEIPFGLVGGYDSSDLRYAAYVSYPDGTATPISGIVGGGSIGAVAMNPSGESLVGGLQTGNVAYAAFIAPSGVVTLLNLDGTSGFVNDVAINASGRGLIGGYDGSSAGFAYAMLPGATTESIMLMNVRTILDTAINDGGVGLIGGEGSDAKAYAAFVDSNNTASLISGLPSGVNDIGDINDVAINGSGKGIIGGWYSPNSTYTYAAFVTTDTLTLIQPTPVTPGFSAIEAVAINALGQGLIGGTEGSNAYAAFVAADGTATPLLGASFGGGIFSAALNDSGVGLIGGRNNLNLYAAFVDSTSVTREIFTDTIPGQINAVAINSEGVGLIGGSTGLEAYAAIVAPNGTLTHLPSVAYQTATNGGSSEILSTAVILSSTTPSSTGPYQSPFYSQFAAAAALENRFIQKSRNGSRGFRQTPAIRPTAMNQDPLALNEAGCRDFENELALTFKKSIKKNQAPTPVPSRTPAPPASSPNSIWMAPFGDIVHLAASGSNPAIRNQIGGFLLGSDRQQDQFLIGAAFGYAFNFVHYSNQLGHGKIHEELGNLYGAFYQNHFWVAAALWGGGYQFSGERHTLTSITSHAKTHGWILTPHLEVASPWAIDVKERYTAEPFACADWVNGWQQAYTETGTSGLHLEMPSYYGSILQAEAGIRFYETFPMSWGDFCLEEKASYVNQTPFHFNPVQTSFVASASTFPIAIGSSDVQHLASLQMQGSFNPRDPRYPYGGFSLQVTGNGNYQSYYASLFAGYDF